MAYNPQGKTRPGTKFAARESYNVDDVRSKEWSEKGYTNGYQDPTRRSAINHVDGNTKPVLAYPSDDGFVTKTETIVEYVRVPMVTGHGNGSPIKMAPVREYEAVDNEWSRPVSPSYDRPPKVGEFISKVQTEARQPPKTGPIINVNWRATPNYHGPGGNKNHVDRHGGNKNHGWSSDYGTEYEKPRGRGKHQPNFDGTGDYGIVYDKPRVHGMHQPDFDGTGDHGIVYDKPRGHGMHQPDFDGTGDYGIVYDKPRGHGKHQPNFDGTGGDYGNTYDKPRGHGHQPNFHDQSRLPKPINDIETVIDHLKDAVIIAAPPHTIDSREAARKYRGEAIYK